jgi:hypothetical protein
MTPDAAAELAKVEELAAKLVRKVDELLAPLETEMRIMRWAPDFRVIMWEAVGHKALERARRDSGT